MEIDIKNYIENNITELKDRFFPIFTTDTEKPSIVYNFTPISGGHIKQSQLESKIIWSDYDQVKEIEDKINKIMDMEEDKPFIAYGNTYFRSSLGGGGLLFRDDLQMYEDTLIFIITWRCNNG
ncbi:MULTISPECIES: hypothetical protein [Clostridium]|uniref:hypothetical protein n=1 Tax=Clostridium TaxID=1485 RepID=UPI0007744E4B|nr:MULTISPECIES: hypothetical protein [Clostridium]AUM96149.1 hypothetical protein RSJ11_13710 [Clostridium sporogenes]AVQ53600.1 hypothetical protein C7M59_12325 [Clostridium botulinum]